MNDIARNQQRRVRKTLLVFPEGMICTGQIDTPIGFNGEKVQNIPCDIQKVLQVYGTDRVHNF